MKKNIIKYSIAIMAALAIIAFWGHERQKSEQKNDQVKSALTPQKEMLKDEIGVEKISLNGTDWNLSFAKQPRVYADNPEDFRKLPEIKTIQATVPGNAEIDLLNAKLIKDPMVGDNVFELRKYESYQWMYSRTFPTPKLEDGQRAILNLQGVDTLADVYVNNRLVGRPENMFIEHKFDITDYLSKIGTNTIDIIIRSAPIESKKYNPVFGGGRDTRSEYMHVRKAASGYGWDIHPRLVTAGLWRDVSLDIENQTRIVDTHFYTNSVNPKDAKASATIDVKIDAPYDQIDNLTLSATISKDGKILYSTKELFFTYSNAVKFNVNGVELWWPRGYGNSTLYNLCVEILDKSGRTIARQNKRIGFRTVTLDFKELELPDGQYKGFGNGNLSAANLKDKVKGEFKFYVNNTPIFMKGTNWVPLDASHSRDAKHVKNALQMIADLNCNMIRCWGGNVYEDSEFFDLCDEYGVMIWQDFAMGCSVYPQDAEFIKKIEEEVNSVVLKLRSHPCLALWAGNNENDQAYSWRAREFKINPSHDRISRFTIPNAIMEYDWSRPYLPSSPYLSEITIKEPNKYAAPEVHLWGPRGYYKDTFYKDSLAIFVSEIGYHGCPNRESLEKMMTKDFVYPWTKDGKWNKQWQAKATMSFPNTHVEENRNNLMTKQVKILFGEVPQDLDEFVFASQAVQAEAKKYFIELWRTQKFEPKTGILWWNLRDAWPILSDAIVDYYGSKKLAYYFIKRVQEDVCVMINDDFEIVVANDTMKPVKGSVVVRDIQTSKEVFKKEFQGKLKVLNVEIKRENCFQKSMKK